VNSFHVGFIENTNRNYKRNVSKIVFLEQIDNSFMLLGNLEQEGSNAHLQHQPSGLFWVPFPPGRAAHGQSPGMTAPGWWEWSTAKAVENSMLRAAGAHADA
jgi:hypothetical protein